MTPDAALGWEARAVQHVTARRLSQWTMSGTVPAFARVDSDFRVERALSRGP
jgi:hypothetical protein